MDPASKIVKVTDPVRLTTTVSGVGHENFSYQWRHNGEDINGETSNTFTIDSVAKADGGNYECKVWNEYGNCVTSNISELSKLMHPLINPIMNFMIETIPKITIHPNSIMIKSGDTNHLSLTCKAIGSKSYCWERRDGNIPPGATGINSETLTLVNLTPDDTGYYRCVVSDDSDEDYSNYAKITVMG